MSFYYTPYFCSRKIIGCNQLLCDNMLITDNYTLPNFFNTNDRDLRIKHKIGPIDENAKSTNSRAVNVNSDVCLWSVLLIIFREHYRIMVPDKMQRNACVILSAALLISDPAVNKDPGSAKKFSTFTQNPSSYAKKLLF